MERPIVENKIAEALKSYPKGSVLFVDDFLDYGNPESVKKALLRLKEKEILVRLVMVFTYTRKLTNNLAFSSHQPKT